MSESPEAQSGLPWWKRMCFGVAAVALGLVPLVLAEGVLAALGLGAARWDDDPFVGFSAVHPLFVRSADGARYEIAKNRRTFFRPDSFASEKPKDEFRIFCLGGSTVQGRPYSIETSFTTWLELSLQAADPSRRWQVVNCGGVSYASYRLVPILEEVLGYKPDMILVYTGQNEFLEDRTYGHVKRTPAALARLHGLFSRLRTYRLARREYARLMGRSPETAPQRPVLKAEVDAMLDYRGGLREYHRDDEWRRDVIEHYAYNMRRMVGLCEEAGVPMILMNPACNLRGTPPFKSEHRDGLSAELLEQWESLWSAAREHYGSGFAQAIELLRQAEAIDGEYAGLHFELAKCYDARGMVYEARAEYLRAKELDVCPLRILEPMQQAVLAIAAETGTPLVDVERLFEKLSPRGIPGDKWLVDHVHPEIEGHQRIAEALTDKMIELGYVPPPPAGWQQRRQDLYTAHYNSLKAIYFARGRQRLDGLRRWAAGRSRLTRPGQKAPKDKP
jgi:tetratricopeptide (TPR) repeat protein